MISENIEGAALMLRGLAGRVGEPEWEEIRSAVRVLDQAAEDAQNMETGVALSAVAIGLTAGPLAEASRATEG
jgi:hypothetical protein